MVGHPTVTGYRLDPPHAPLPELPEHPYQQPASRTSVSPGVGQQHGLLIDRPEGKARRARQTFGRPVDHESLYLPAAPHGETRRSPDVIHLAEPFLGRVSISGPVRDHGPKTGHPAGILG
jgi:hypothetical protein